GLRMNLTPASSSDLPSAAGLTRVSESGTRLIQTAIFMQSCAFGLKSQEKVLELVSVVRRLSLIERADPGDLLPQNQGVDVVRAFVGVDRLEVRQMPHRLILGEDAVGAEQPPRLARDIGRHADVVA